MERSEVSTYIHEQNQNRKLWAETDTPEHIARMLDDEATELQEALKEAYITGDAFSVASEIGDVLYLVYRLCDLIGINPEQAVEMKITRNGYKYNDHITSNGRTGDEARKISKEVWEKMGGDKMFSRLYLDYLAHDE